MTKTFYKATRPNGTDFYTGTILYEPGTTVKPKGTGTKICGPGLLHAADVPAETLVGGSWPCRLFEVTGKPVAGLDESHPHKAGFKHLVVVQEIPAYLALGPNGENVAALIERAGKLTKDEIEKLYAAWYAARDAAGDAARYAARDAVWYAAWYAARDAAWYAAWDAARDAAGDAAGDAARYAARDAALALVVQDLITDDQFKTLYGPWGETIKDVKIK